MVSVSSTGFGPGYSAPKMMRFSLLLFLLAVVLACPASAQWQESELMRISRQTFPDSAFKPRKPEYLFRKAGLLVKYNPASLFFGGLLYFYQKAISPQISVECPYEINCSNFSKRCIRHYGLFKGLALTADRLTRCTPYTRIDLNTIQLSRKNKIIDSLSYYQWRP